MVLAACATASFAQQAAADREHHATHLGGARAFYVPGVRSAAQLRKMMARPRMESDLQAVLSAGGAPQLLAQMRSLLSNAKLDMSAPTRSCFDVDPPTGLLVSCAFPVGRSLLWMAYRPNMSPKIPRRSRRPDPELLMRVVWSGAQPFPAFVFRIANTDGVYTFVLPQACANLSLVSFVPTPRQPPHLTLSKAVDKEKAHPSDTLRYSLTYVNDGGSDATGVTLTDTLPSEVRFLNADSGGSHSGRTVTWAVGTLKPGTTSTVTIEAQLSDTFPIGDTRVENRASLTSRELSPIERRAATIVTVERPALPVISLTKAVDKARAKPGETLTYTLRYANSGEAAATSVKITDVLPPDVTFVGATPPQPSSSNTVVWNVGSLQPNASGTIELRAKLHDRFPRGETVETNAATMEAVGLPEQRAEATTTVVSPEPANRFFVDGLLGKDRRVRPADPSDGKDAEFAQCSALAGIKIGVTRTVSPQWQLEVAGGAAVSLVRAADKVNESELFADAALDRFSSRWFVGTGLSAWDLSRANTISPAWLAHVGYALDSRRDHHFYFIAEGRLLLNHVGDVSNNYQFWGGVRFFPSGQPEGPHE